MTEELFKENVTALYFLQVVTIIVVIIFFPVVYGVNTLSLLYIPNRLIFLTVIWVFGVCFSIKKYNEKQDVINGTSILNRCKRDFKIGFGGMFAFACTCLFLTVIMPMSGATQWLILNHAAFSTTTLCYFFVRPTAKSSYIHVDVDDDGSSYVGASVIAVPIAFSILCLFYPWQNLMISIPLTFFVTVDTTAICVPLARKAFRGEVDLLDGIEGFEEDDFDSSYEELECKVCLLKYSSTSVPRTPRVLTACGHTVCHKCLSNLLKNNFNRTGLACSFCRMITIVPDKAPSKLPKNFAIIELIEELKRKRKVEKIPKTTPALRQDDQEGNVSALPRDTQGFQENAAPVIVDPVPVITDNAVDRVIDDVATGIMNHVVADVVELLLSLLT